MNFNKKEYLFIVSKLKTAKEAEMFAAKLNNKIEELKNENEEITITLLTYSSTYQIDIERVNVEDVKPFTKADFTSKAKKSCFYDAFISGVDALGESLAAMDEADRPCKVTVVFEEEADDNSSKKATIELVHQVIEEQANVYSWSFDTI